jgi:hypothetical protein
MRWLFIVFALLVGVAIGIEYQKSISGHAPIFVKVGGPGAQALLNPQVGDIVEWKSSTGNITPTLTWIFGVSPCDTNYTSDCHILPSADGKNYAYSCPSSSPCDPEIPIGSTTGPLYPSVTPTNISGVALPEVYIGCDANHQNVVATSPNPAPVSESVQGGTFWDGITPVTAWTVGTWKDSGGNSANVCTQTTINQGQAVCTLTPSLPTGNYTYSVTASACATPTGTFTLQVNQ